MQLRLILTPKTSYVTSLINETREQEDKKKEQKRAMLKKIVIFFENNYFQSHKNMF